MLKLSVLKDFLSGIQKKVDWPALTCPCRHLPSILGPALYIVSMSPYLTFPTSPGPKGTAGHELHSTPCSTAASHTQGQDHPCAGL